MDLKISDVADLLGISETTIQNWISEKKIPCYTLQDEYRFSREEIESWMLGGMRSDGKEMALTEDADGLIHPGMWQRYGFYRALHKGMVIDGIEPTDKPQFIAQVMERATPQLSLDAEGVTALLLDREKLMPTGLNQGIAVPHTRDFLLSGFFDSILVVYPTEPIEWGSLDNEKVHTLFFLFACDDKRHLNLLAKIAHFVSCAEAMEFLKTRPNKQELLAYLKNWESTISQTETIATS
ncbi:MAG: hypothetical protein S4CHLAM102_14590 [Chlamydiia bacterium]|nr:hypothetical protein [Chlamydiia bacterium]